MQQYKENSPVQSDQQPHQHIGLSTLAKSATQVEVQSAISYSSASSRVVASCRLLRWAMTNTPRLRCRQLPRGTLVILPIQLSTAHRIRSVTFLTPNLVHGALWWRGPMQTWMADISTASIHTAMSISYSSCRLPLWLVIDLPTSAIALYLKTI